MKGIDNVEQRKYIIRKFKFSVMSKHFYAVV
jgi:hypothetical protein